MNQFNIHLPLRYFDAIALRGLLLFCMIAGLGGQGESYAAPPTLYFIGPENVTESYHPDVMDASHPWYRLDNFRLSRNTSQQLAFDASGTLHLTYWSGFVATTPDWPAAVYYQSWSQTGGWSVPAIVDESFVTGNPAYEGERMGGRHPSLTVAPDGDIWISWHDHRHCGVDPPYNGINNIEIYCASKSAGGSFAGPDVRLTNTSASHFGDNGYIARIGAAPDGKLSVLWYDFHADGFYSDIFLLTSDNDGVFDTSLPMLERRLTGAEDRVAVPPQTMKPAFNMPDLVIAPEGQRYAVWSQDFGGSVGNDTLAPIYFAEVPEQPALVSYEAVVPDNDGYWYPPRLAVAPNGDLWLMYTVTEDTTSRVEMRRRPSGVAAFGPAIELTEDGRHRNADLAIDTEGRLHVVWEEFVSSQNLLVHYSLLSADGSGVLLNEVLTPESGRWSSPAIALKDGRIPVVVYCEGNSDTLGAVGDIWFVRGVEYDPAGVQVWRAYR